MCLEDSHEYKLETALLNCGLKLLSYSFRNDFLKTHPNSYSYMNQDHRYRMPHFDIYDLSNHWYLKYKCIFWKICFQEKVWFMKFESSKLDTGIYDDYLYYSKNATTHSWCISALVNVFSIVKKISFQKRKYRNCKYKFCKIRYQIY